MKNLLLIVLTACSCIETHAQNPIKMPEGKEAIIVLSYDDALTSHLDVAIPQLDSANLKGTFFLNKPADQSHITRWRAAALNGHELGNHTLFHPCLSTVFEADPRYQSENYSTNNLLDEISVMNSLLFAIDGKESRTFAYPCGETTIDGKSYVDSLKSVGIAYARGVGNSPIINDLEKLNYFNVPCRGFSTNAPSSDLINFVKEVQKSNALGVLIFHGVGGDYLEISAEAHHTLVQYLKKNDKIWVATFEEAMDYITR